MHPEIQFRYTNKQLLQIFKSLGRFQSPLEQTDAYKLDLASSEGSSRKASSDSGDSEKSLKVKQILQTLIHAKPVVVLEHLKSI